MRFIFSGTPCTCITPLNIFLTVCIRFSAVDGDNHSRACVVNSKYIDGFVLFKSDEICNWIKHSSVKILKFV